VEILGVQPGAVAAILSQMFNHETNIFEMLDARFGLPEPKTFRIPLHQLSRPRH